MKAGRAKELRGLEEQNAKRALEQLDESREFHGISFFSPAEVSRMLTVHRSTVYRWIAAGHMPAKRLSRLLRIPADQYREWLESYLEDAGEYSAPQEGE